MLRKHRMLIINLHKQQALTFVQFSDLVKNVTLCTLIIVNISLTSAIDPITFDIRRIVEMRFKCM